MEDRCVSCGSIIPEGQQVCERCKEREINQEGNITTQTNIKAIEECADIISKGMRVLAEGIRNAAADIAESMENGLKEYRKYIRNEQKEKQEPVVKVTEELTKRRKMRDKNRIKYMHR